MTRKQSIASNKGQIASLSFGAVVTDTEDPRYETVLLAVVPREDKHLILILEDGVENKPARFLPQNSLHSSKKNRIPQTWVA